jgi:arginine utilization protein RocB
MALARARGAAYALLEEEPTVTESLASSAAAWALELVGRPSVNGTAAEAAFAEWLCRRLAASPPFAGVTGQVWTIPVPDDPLGRASVAALLRGRGPKTVMLTGHFDTVRVDDYGELAPIATVPEALKAALLERLARTAATPSELLALADLRGGDFLPGRGLLDMKSGLAAGLAAMAAWASDPNREGNLLFLAVPDEEASSAGARSAAQALPQQLASLGLTLEAAINLDALLDDGDGVAGRRVALGTVGKLLPSALVVGRAAHAANALQGVNAGALMAGIVTELEWSEALTDSAGEEVAAPPTLLGLSDHRPSYDVTTPERVWAYWNVMTLHRSPAEVLAGFAELCRRAVAEALRTLAARGPRPSSLPTEVPILTFESLRSEVLARDPHAAERMADLARSVAARGLDLPEQCRLITEGWWAASGQPGPAVVVGFASMPYLPTELHGSGGLCLEAAVRQAARRVAGRHATTIGLRPRFPAISDMSFLGQVDEGVVPAIAANTPAWSHGIVWPAGRASLGVPIVNAGPWGRDYHTPLERLHTAYAFEVLPELLLEIARGVLAGVADGA